MTFCILVLLLIDLTDPDARNTRKAPNPNNRKRISTERLDRSKFHILGAESQTGRLDELMHDRLVLVRDHEATRNR